MQLAAPKSPEGVTDNQHRQRKQGGGGGSEEDEEGVCTRSRRVWGRDGHYPNGSLCPIYPSHAAIAPRPRHRSFNWPGTQCLPKHSASLEKRSVGECGEVGHAGNIVGRSVRCMHVCLPIYEAVF